MGLARCVQCRRTLTDEQMYETSCVHHSGDFIVVPSWPKNAAPISGTHLGWSCCFAKEKEAPGCTTTPHVRDHDLDEALKQFSPTRPGALELPQPPAGEPEAAVQQRPPQPYRAALGEAAATPTRGPDGAEYIVHTVGPLDTLMGVALRYRTTVHAIARANKLPGQHAFSTRKTLLVPYSPEALVAEPQPASPQETSSSALERTLAVRKLRNEARVKLGEVISQHEAQLYLDETARGVDWLAAFKEFSEDIAWERSQGTNRAFALRRFDAAPLGKRRVKDALPVSVGAGGFAQTPALSALQQPLLG